MAIQLGISTDPAAVTFMHIVDADVFMHVLDAVQFIHSFNQSIVALEFKPTKPLRADQMCVMQLFSRRIRLSHTKSKILQAQSRPPPLHEKDATSALLVCTLTKSCMSRHAITQTESIQHYTNESKHVPSSSDPPLTPSSHHFVWCSEIGYNSRQLISPSCSYDRRGAAIHVVEDSSQMR